jgi:predicted HTH domain antitoxin
MLVISDELVQSTKMSERDLKIEIAIALYEKGILSFGQARKLAGMEYFEFEKLLFDRNVPSGYTADDLESDLATLKKLREK